MPSRATSPASTATSTATSPSLAARQLEAELAAAVARAEAHAAAAREARRLAVGEAFDDAAAAIARRRYEAQVVIDQDIDDAAVAAAKAELEQLPKSWALPVTDGAYSQVVALRARSWLRAVRSWVEGENGRAALRSARQGVSSTLKVAEHDAEHADQMTGRGVTTSHATVSRDTGIHVDNVRKIRKVLRRAGWEQEIVRGRYLRKAEREIAADVHGGTQWRAASVRALTVPTREAAARIAAEDAQHAEQVRTSRRQAQQRRRVCRRAPRRQVNDTGDTRRASTPLPPSGQFSQLLSSSEVTNARNARGGRSKIQQKQPHSRAAHRLAARLMATIGISKIRHAPTAPLVRAVAPLADAGWTAREVLSTIDCWQVDHRVSAIPVAAQRNPLGLLIHQIGAACDPATSDRQNRKYLTGSSPVTEQPGTGVRKPANFTELVALAEQQCAPRRKNP